MPDKPSNKLAFAVLGAAGVLSAAIVLGEFWETSSLDNQITALQAPLAVDNAARADHAAMLAETARRADEAAELSALPGRIEAVKVEIEILRSKLPAPANIGRDHPLEWLPVHS